MRVELKESGFSGTLAQLYREYNQGRRAMNPQERFCHNKDCRAYGRKGEGHIVIHSKKERRYTDSG